MFEEVAATVVLWTRADLYAEQTNVDVIYDYDIITTK